MCFVCEGVSTVNNSDSGMGDTSCYPRRGYKLRCNFNILAGIVGDLVLGLHLLSDRPTAEWFRNILVTTVPGILEEVVQAVRQTDLRHTMESIFDCGKM